MMMCTVVLYPFFRFSITEDAEVGGSRSDDVAAVESVLPRSGEDA
jgi:hypothetical protein